MKAMTRKKKTVKNEPRLSEETIESVVSLGIILRKIHNRLVAEGKITVGKNGKVIVKS